MPIETDETVYFALTDELSTEGLDDRLVEVTEETADFLRRAIGKVARALRPDLASIGATKATVKMGAKVGVKNGKLTAWITEVSGEGTIEVSVEFAGPPS